MTIDVLVAEIGSTTTIVNAFNINPQPVFLGRGISQTTVDTDVVIGLKAAIKNLEETISVKEIAYKEMFATSSAAGGLKVTVSGLVYEMTVKASKEAALNAGANIHLINAGVLTNDDLQQIKEINPNMIIIAGGTDYGEKETAFANITKVEKLSLDVPIIYAGNEDNHYRIKENFKNSNQKEYLKIVENVYPRVDYMNILPLREAIYKTFEEHIIKAKGMSHIKKMVNASIMPTPGSVMEATMRLHDSIGDLITIDIGGATSDIHSIAIPSEDYKEYFDGTPTQKRTVEGDLGVFVNLKNTLPFLDIEKFMLKHNIARSAFDKLIDSFPYLPISDIEKDLLYEVTKICVHQSLDRHIGDYRKVYTSNGLKILPEGRDCSQVKTIVLTGGALLHSRDSNTIIHTYLEKRVNKMIPNKPIKILTDNHYIMASLGVLSLKYPEAALKLLKQSFNIKEG